MKLFNLFRRPTHSSPSTAARPPLAATRTTTPLAAAAAAAIAITLLSPTAAFAGGPPAPVCALWENGTFDETDGFFSMLLTAPATATTDVRAADDFYLEPGYVYRIDTITATFFSNVEIPNARLELRSDCDGTPGPVIASFETPAIAPAGTYMGQAIRQLTFNTPGQWLKGGQYWVSIYVLDVPGNKSFQWATTGPAATDIGGPTKGSIAHIISPSQGLTEWTAVDVAGCCCTDLAFSVRGHKCKILHNNGGYDVLRGGPLGSPSIDNSPDIGANAFTADNFVTNPCGTPARLCYIEAWIASNCPNARIDLYRSNCENPGQNVITLVPEIIDTGVNVMIDGKNLDVLCLRVVFETPLALPVGETLWVSAYGLGDGSFNRAAYFLRNAKCDQTSCLVKFSPGRVRGPGVSQANWVKTKPIIGSAEDYDFAFLVAIEDPDSNSETGGPNGTADCAGDYDRNGVWDLIDLLNFVEAWLPGCP